MWKREAQGRTLTFHLAGINNQNFIMRDQETGSFWQQVTGKCISGPLKDATLQLEPSDELTFGLWKQESPEGQILAPDAALKEKYEHPDWEQQAGKLPIVVKVNENTLPARELVAGVEVGGASKAYPVSRISQDGPIEDSVGGIPVLLARGPDGKSLRAFVRRIPGKAEDVDFYKRTGTDWVLMDSATSSLWNFRGCAVEGPAKGACLQPVYPLKSYWFDWQAHHPQTLIYRR